MEELKTTASDPQFIDVTIKGEDLKKGFRKWKEENSTSPSGRGLAIYKTLLQAPKEDEETVLGVDTLFDMLADIIQIAHNMEHPLKRCQRVHNKFILKNLGTILLNSYGSYTYYMRN